jgi:hypothetical protein
MSAPGRVDGYASAHVATTTWWRKGIYSLDPQNRAVAKERHGDAKV